MRNPARNAARSWLLTLIGGALVYFSYAPFLTYLQTGQAFRQHSRNFPGNAYGGDAALFDAVCLLLGLFFIAAGLRGLISTK